MSDVSASPAPANPGISLGSRLAALREKKGLPLEQAARETRIRVQRLREIENDDLSHFAHPSYARLFLADYAKYLGLPTEEIQHRLPATGTCGCEGYQYLQDEMPRLGHRAWRKPRRSRVRRTVGFSALGLVLIVCGIWATNTMRRLSLIDLNEVAKRSDQAVIAQPENQPQPPAVEESAPVTAPEQVAPASTSVDSAENVSVDHAETATAPSVTTDAAMAIAPVPGDSPAAAAPANTPAVPLYVGGAVNAGHALQ